MKFIAIIADNWEQFVTKNANHGFYFDKRLGTATREGASASGAAERVCIVFIDAHDQAFTREQTQGTVYDAYKVVSAQPDADVVACVASRCRSNRPIPCRSMAA